MEFSANELIQKQFELRGKIRRTVENLNKKGQVNRTQAAIQTRFQILDKLWRAFEINNDILTFKHKEALKSSDYEREKIAETVEEEYLEQRTILQGYSDELKENSSGVSTSPSSRIDEASHSHSTLPRIQIPSFSGRYEDWPSFKDLFQSIMGTDKRLSQVEKLHFLKVSLKGSAEALIKELPTTNDNYTRAWKILTDQYENKRVLVRSCLANFASLKKSHQESANELEKLINCVTSTVHSLESLGRPIKRSEDWFVYSVAERLDDQTRSKWEESISSSNEPPSYEELNKFLSRRLQTLQALGTVMANKQRQPATERTNPTAARAVRSNHAEKRAVQVKCALCHKEHFLMHCEQYKAKGARDRKFTVDSTGSCVNCLGNHKISACTSKRGCFVCGERHHSSLHEAFKLHDSAAASKTNAHLTYDCRARASTVLLATARILVEDVHGTKHAVRALVDQGSEVSMVTESLVQRLRLPRVHCSLAVFGVGGQQVASARGSTSLVAWSCLSNDKVLISALILPKLTSYASSSITKVNWPHLQNLEMADPGFASTEAIEVILGADVYSVILKDGVRKGDPQEPIAQNTVFGWILSGLTGTGQQSLSPHSHQISVGDSLNSLVRQFWEQEEIPSATSSLTHEEQECENFFQTTYARNHEGRFIVRLPFSKAVPDFSNSRIAAASSLSRMEKRFKINEEFRKLYVEFMEAYEDLGHMTQVKNSNQGKNVCYLPHHGIFRAASATTRLRVVFNGSWSSSTTKALNQHLHTGPNLLPNLSDILLRWRMHAVVFVADIEKMYRQIIIHPDDRNFQRILWRRTDLEEVHEYQLNTVTYGLACAPFLAIRTLHQLANDGKERFPKAAAVLLQDTYMDDIVTGAANERDLAQTKSELISLCRAGGFNLQKWASNCSDLLTEENQTKAVVVQDKAGAASDWAHSTLGLLWHQSEDHFSFTIHEPPVNDVVTKRTMLSQCSQLFDPLGWLAPTIVKAKIMFQSTWLLGLGWDDPLPEGKARAWQNFTRELTLWRTIRIPRNMVGDSERSSWELHGFSDASEKAFAAVLYIRYKGANQKYSVSLISAKTKVAPIKPVSLPRLELCGAHLLTRLANHVVSVLKLDEVPLHLWTDSTVTLGWIRGQPTRWKTYVANRVAEIQRLAPEAHWHHVEGSLNPADAASRGLSPKALLACSIWWEGPQYLQNAHIYSVSQPEEPDLDELPEAKEVVLVHSTQREENPILTRFSDYRRLIRVTAWCRRWLQLRNSTDSAKSAELGDSSTREFLSKEELQEAETHWIKLLQKRAYAEEIQAASKNLPISRRSKILVLTPFQDQQGCLRVGGRIKHSLLAFDEKHPIILPPGSRFTNLLIEHVHRESLHGGVQATLGALRLRFWIPSGRNLVKRAIKQCVRCIRWRSTPGTQIMADLPQQRVIAARPFLHTGVDYAGPIWLRTAPGRGQKSYKGFFVVFVCMVTRAVHLDAVSDYTTEAFLATFRRFISRRGLCSDIYSDCGTNFQGADNELRQLFSARSTSCRNIQKQLAECKVQWHFNPPASPHFGGLWEAAVKSTKHHLRRVIGENKLTYEEMATLLSQVEACLNSRPLSAVTDDPQDLAALTPGHFLIGSALNAVPEPTLLDQKPARLSRWQLLVQIRDQFWQRWVREYLHGLLTRPKWKRPDDNYQVGRLCLITTENTSPCRWPLARIESVHPGADGKTRVCTLKTASTTLVRSIHKLVLLPASESPLTAPDAHSHHQEPGS